MKPGAKSSANIFGPRFESCHDPAVPPPTAASVASGSRPAAWAKVTASATARLVTLTRIWFTSFVSWPEPTGPQWVIVFP